MTDNQSPDTRTCAWTGKEFEGKGYILRTTEHPEEIVSADALRNGESASDGLARQVKRLEARVQQLEANSGDAEDGDAKQAPPRRARKTAATKPSAPQGA